MARRPGQKARRTARLEHAKRYAARDAVFNTFELLELILVQLDPQDVLASSYVCQQFNSTIKTSKPVQNAFNGNGTHSFEYWTLGEYAGRPNFSPWHTHTHLCNELYAPTRNRLCEYLSSTSRPLKAVTVHPLLQSQYLSTDVSYHPARKHRLLQSVADQVEITPKSKTSLEAFFQGREQPWENFQITMPPTFEASVFFSLILGDSACVSVKTELLEDTNGLTLGGVMRAIRDGRNPGRECWVTESFGEPSWWEIHEESLVDVLSELRKRNGRERLTFDGPHFELPGVIALTEADKRDLVRTCHG